MHVRPLVAFQKIGTHLTIIKQHNYVNASGN